MGHGFSNERDDLFGNAGMSEDLSVQDLSAVVSEYVLVTAMLEYVDERHFRGTVDTMPKDVEVERS